MKKISLFLVSLLFVSSTAYAIAPAIIWIGRTTAAVAAESIVMEGVSRGFAANDPYVKNRITVPTKNIPAAFKKSKGWLNPYWTAFALAAGLLLEGDQFKQVTQKDDFVYLVCNTVTFGPPGDAVVAPCAYSSSTSRFHSINEISRVSTGGNAVAVNFGSQLGVIQSHQILIKYFSETTWNPIYFNYDDVWRKDGGGRSVIGYVSAEPRPVGSTKRDVTDSEVALLASAYLASDNRPADAFMDVTGKPIPELMENAVIQPVPNVDADTLKDLAAYRAGVLQTTDPAAENYVTPERYEEIKKLAAQQDAVNTPEGELDALNEEIKQPITQAQYEETNKKYSDAVDSVTNTLPNNDSDIESIDDSFNKLDGIITDIPNASLPSPAHIQLPQYTDCITLSLTDGKGRELVFPSSSQCEKINQMKSLIGYFLAGLVAMGLIWQLLTRPHG